MNNDRNLLFGIFAVQLRKVTPAQLVETAAAWTMDPSKDLSQRLIEAQIINESDRDRINMYVNDAVAAHEGDPVAALSSLDAAHRAHDTIESMKKSLKSVSPLDQTKLSPQRWLELGPVEDVPAVDETPGRYTRSSEYARGGIGRVLLVHDQYLGREIALKELLPIVSTDDATLDVNEPTPVQASTSLVFRFLQEARITGQLEHPSIVPVYELGRRKDGTIYYTMKLVRGRTFAQALRETGSLQERLKLLPHLIDLCQAIGYAHSRNVIHRDIKPNNVMIGEFGETVVLDWGLAKVRGQQDYQASQIEHTLKTLRVSDEAEAEATVEGQILGTPTFMPPEQAQGDLKNISERSDVYSLGAVLYSLLTGQYPFGGRNAKEILEQVLHQEPEPVEAIVPDAPPELIAICRRAMQRDPRKRYANGRELVDELARFQAGALVSAYSYSFREHLWRFANRHRAVLSTAAASLIILLGTAVFSYVQVSRDRNAAIAAKERESEQRLLATQARDAERVQRERAEKQLYLSNILLAQSRIDERRFDVAERVLDAAPASLRNWEWNHLKRLCHQEEWTFAGSGVPVEDVAVSPDGSLVLTASDDGIVHVVDAATGQQTQTLGPVESKIQRVWVNADGSRALTTVLEGAPRLWNVATTELVAILEAHPIPASSAGFSPDGKQAVTGSSDGTIKVWDTATGSETTTIAGDPNLLEVLFNADGSQVAERCTTGPVILFDTVSGDRVATLESPEGSVQQVEFSADGRLIAVAAGNTTTLWNGIDFSRAFTLSGHEAEVSAIAFNPDGSQLVSGSEDATLRLWDTASGSSLLVSDGHGDTITDVAFVDMPNRFISASLDHTVRVWDGVNGAEVRRLEGHSGPVRRLLAYADGRSVVTCSDDRAVKRWSIPVPPGSPQLVLRGHSDAIRSIQFNPIGETLLSVSYDGTARVWDGNTGGITQTIALESGKIFCADWSPDGRVIATGSNDSIARTWDAITGDAGLELEGHDGPVSGVYFSPDGSSLLTISWDQNGILWDLRTGSAVHHIEHADGRRGLAAFSPDGSLAATVTGDHSVTLWNADTGTASAVLQGHTNRISAIRFSQDASRVLTTSLDGTARVWNGKTGEPVTVLDGQHQSIRDGALSPDGTRVATAADDGTIQLWDASTGDRLGDLLGHRDSVTTALYLDDGARILSGSVDGTVRLWDADTGTTVLTLTGAEFGTGVVVTAGRTQLAGAMPDGPIVLWSN